MLTIPMPPFLCRQVDIYGTVDYVNIPTLRWLASKSGELQGIPLQLSDHGVADPAVPESPLAIDPDRRLTRERCVEMGETAASAAAYLKQP